MCVCVCVCLCVRDAKLLVLDLGELSITTEKQDKSLGPAPSPEVSHMVYTMLNLNMNSWAVFENKFGMQLFVFF